MADIDLNAAALNPPNGTEQNLDNSPNHKDVTIAVYTISIAIASIFIIIRLYTKFVFLKAPRAEDYKFFLFLGILLRMIGTTGQFIHQWNFRVGGLAPFYHKGLYATSILYDAVRLTIKPLILFKWVHIFASAGPRNAFDWTCYTLATINTLVFVIDIWINAATCTPREYWWDKTISGHCADVRPLEIAVGVFNAILDLFILLLPQGIIWKLQLPRTKRIGPSHEQFLSIILTTLGDTTYHFSQVGIISIIEMTAAILVFTTPTVPKPITYPAKQASSWFGRLIRWNRSGFPHESGNTGLKRNIYYHIEEQDNSWPMIKLRA
ncbi:uncharacterized protein F4807DRAFT_472697 [Annulohypoxylon truncatum]|uniref:uncharacterized protein n=1 Tax=Annulohypoxylon truncatum TaxID=327061 RepID=UPI0020088333|nr:uncharacterized protein F4807DRAFT_472697 [Annulohypoxylon truncatum]KAI1204092.1 hypothetical protein F4807DRAFT_472697 [Annulohypoxylon truncatum]